MIPPGSWPASIPTRIGNGYPLLRQSMEVNPDGDLLYITYAQQFGCVTLRVFND
jgi:hypothetical protein